MNGWYRVFRKTMQIMATSTNDAYVDLSDWIPSIGVDNLQATLKVSGSAGPQTVRVKLAVQGAPVRTDKAGQWAAYDSYQSGDGERATVVVSVATQLNATQSFRLGLACSLSS